MAQPTVARLPDPDADVLVLVTRHQPGEALALLMRRHGGALYRFCRERLHDASLAEDTLQQVFLEAFRDLERFSRASTVRAWLFGIARHRVLDFAKHRSRTLVREDRAAADDPEPAATPSELLDDARLLAALVACIQELDADIQDLLLLRYQQGLTYDEIATVFGDKPTTLHARVTRALPLLRAKIERHLARAHRR